MNKNSSSFFRGMARIVDMRGTLSRPTYQQLKQRIKRSQTPEEARAENGKAIGRIWQSVGDDIWKATKDYEDDLNAGD